MMILVTFKLSSANVLNLVQSKKNVVWYRVNSLPNDKMYRLIQIKSTNQTTIGKSKY